MSRRLIFLKIYFCTLDFYETIKTNKKHLGKKIFVKTLYWGSSNIWLQYFIWGKSFIYCYCFESLTHDLTKIVMCLHVFLLILFPYLTNSMEALYQESGRAGRDQLPWRSLLYYGMDDRKRMVASLTSTLPSLFFF